MERKEPSAGLVDTLGDEIGRIYLAVVKRLLVFKRIVYLCIRHGAGVKPHVDEVFLAIHRFSGGREQNDVIDIGTMEVYAVIILLGVITGYKSGLAIEILLHESGLDGTVHLGAKLLDR